MLSLPHLLDTGLSQPPQGTAIQTETQDLPCCTPLFSLFTPLLPPTHLPVSLGPFSSGMHQEFLSCFHGHCHHPWPGPPIAVSHCHSPVHSEYCSLIGFDSSVQFCHSPAYISYQWLLLALRIKTKKIKPPPKLPPTLNHSLKGFVLLDLTPYLDSLRI